MSLFRKSLVASLAFAAVAGLSGCTNESAARKALLRDGYQPIEVGGYDFFASWKHPLLCHENDSKTKFTAKDPNGYVVKGAVCSGYFASWVAVD